MTDLPFPIPATGWAAPGAGAMLEISLGAVAANYRLLRARTGQATCAAVVKADAYGLGAHQVAPVLEQAGAKVFFVAHLEEGIRLRPHVSPTAQIFVLHGPMPGTERAFTHHALLPVLNSMEQIAGWRAHASKAQHALPAALQVDTGMSRFGLSDADVTALADTPALLDGIETRLVMSHLACADTPASPANALQRDRLRAMAARLPAAPLALSASSGIFLGPDYHFDLVRPGAALYGLAPNADAPNPLQPTVRLQARIVQRRTIKAGDGVGYGLTWHASGPRRIATLGIGYADGFLRQGASNGGCAWLDSYRLPILGRISMDSTTVDVTGVPESVLDQATHVDMIGPRRSVDDVAHAAGTIGYEVLTALGSRFHRVYLPAQAA
ncbi:alanine racemase [Komagataeibacter rhaeticus]|uniref:Alanine racemase n=1 Tax=Komagataeibacter rhaeticus TaxID=215221 RepID=A0A181C9R4_9PROT|nr:alanine racemase [Komagataeibacter rhaeticus]ATU73144.1 alanine racemase [Komagataeibacter xylinus]EGG76966.1 Alanine racemase [Gluconacetobacter sp. SXCC-1]KDU96736.1 alanine racemase [Komagataeibacter rhaeticus AF1]MBL7241067.1 alanine racemase [Komagataeibacter rhaeticus]PYD54362.1 alanine racemase [Komagataeibacter rhaeticus]